MKNNKMFLFFVVHFICCLILVILSIITIMVITNISSPLEVFVPVLLEMVGIYPWKSRYISDINYNYETEVRLGELWFDANPNA